MQNKTLNKKIWNTETNMMLPEVREKLLRTVELFVKTSDIEFDIASVHIVGSNASYNYTEYSDLDVHIVVNFDLTPYSKDILQAYFNVLRSAFNKNYDISIRGIHVELYVEDILSGTVSNGIYDLIENQWIKFPVKNSIIDPDVSEEANKLENNIDLSSTDIEYISKVINNLYMIRKNSLAVDGEHGKGNLIFKEIRNRGILEKLKERLRYLQSKDLTVEKLTESYSSIYTLLNRIKE